VLFLVNAGTTSHDLVIRDSSGKRLAASELGVTGDSFVFTSHPDGGHLHDLLRPARA